jgi:hypothetical protein
MEPLARAAQLRANATGVPLPLVAKILKELKEIGASDDAGWRRLRDAYLSAAREDLEKRP